LQVSNDTFEDVAGRNSSIHPGLNADFEQDTTSTVPILSISGLARVRTRSTEVSDRDVGFATALSQTDVGRVGRAAAPRTEGGPEASSEQDHDNADSSQAASVSTQLFTSKAAVKSALKSGMYID
jgi:hypothetical protein